MDDDGFISGSNILPALDCADLDFLRHQAEQTGQPIQWPLLSAEVQANTSVLMALFSEGNLSKAKYADDARYMSYFAHNMLRLCFYFENGTLKSPFEEDNDMICALDKLRLLVKKKAKANMEWLKTFISYSEPLLNLFTYALYIMDSDLIFPTMSFSTFEFKSKEFWQKQFVENGHENENQNQNANQNENENENEMNDGEERKEEKEREEKEPMVEELTHNFSCLSSNHEKKKQKEKEREIEDANEKEKQEDQERKKNRVWNANQCQDLVSTLHSWSFSAIAIYQALFALIEIIIGDHVMFAMFIRTPNKGQLLCNALCRCRSMLEMELTCSMYGQVPEFRTSLVRKRFKKLLKTMQRLEDRFYELPVQEEEEEEEEEEQQKEEQEEEQQKEKQGKANKLHAFKMGFDFIR